MSDYVLQVNYREDDEPVRITLHGYSPGDAETAHQALESELENARGLNAPVIFSGVATGDDPDDGVAIDPSRVTGVDLVAPVPGEA